MNRLTEGMYVQPNPVPVQTMPMVEKKPCAEGQLQAMSLPVHHVYQCDHGMAEKVLKQKEKLIMVCKHHISRTVRVQTIHGEWYEGTIVNVDTRYLYLQVSHVHDPMGDYRAFINPYNPIYPPYYNPTANFIIPLVLYELLVISLLL